MNGETTDIGLSQKQVGQLMQLRNEYQDQIGHNISEPEIWFGNHLSNYLSALCLDAAIEVQKLKKRRPTSVRQKTMLAFESYLQRKPTAEDLIDELSRYIMVPEFACEVIRRDIDRLLVLSN